MLGVFLSPFYRREANNVSGEVIFSLQKDVKSGDGGVLSLLHHSDVATLRKSRGSPLADPCFVTVGVIFGSTKERNANCVGDK